MSEITAKVNVTIGPAMKASLIQIWQRVIDKANDALKQTDHPVAVEFLKANIKHAEETILDIQAIPESK